MSRFVDMRYQQEPGKLSNLKLANTEKTDKPPSPIITVEEIEEEINNYCNLLKMSDEDLHYRATGLISKHYAHLDLTFFDHPKTLTEALYGIEIGWELILREALNYDEKPILTMELCMDIFDKVIDQGLEYHQKICGTKNYDNELLSCGGDKCIIMKSPGTWKVIKSLNDTDAKLLSVLLAVDRKVIKEFDPQDYTPETIVKVINHLKQINPELLVHNIDDTVPPLEDDDLSELEEIMNDQQINHLINPLIAQKVNNFLDYHKKKLNRDHTNTTGDIITNRFSQKGIVAEIIETDEKEEYNNSNRMEEVD